tara:strand:+ start:9270 stop:9437 length:168 start_codon:yes stop_codon:yes gene_type:complete
MEFFKYIFSNYSGDLSKMLLAYIGIISIVLIFFPFKKIVAFIKELLAIIGSVFKK